MKTSFRSHSCKWSPLTILCVLACSLGLPGQSRMMAAANSAGPVRDLNLSSGTLHAPTPELEAFMQARGKKTRGWVFNKSRLCP